MAEPRSESLQTLERGLRVLETFSRERPALTLSDVARLTGLTRASARRILLTLERLGYVRSEERRFSLAPRVLNLGWAYMSSLGIAELAQPLIRELANELEEAVSIAILDWPDVVYLARVYPQRRVYASTLSVGSRLPAHATAVGRVLLAALPDDTLSEYLGGPLPRYNERTVCDPDELRALIEGVRRRGWAISDQEVEVGIRSVAAPIRDATGNVIASLTASTTTPRATLADLRKRLLPRVVESARRLSSIADAQDGASTPPRSWPAVAATR